PDRRAFTSIVPDLPFLPVMVCILAKGSGDCDITRIPWPSASAAFAELPGHYLIKRLPAPIDINSPLPGLPPSPLAAASLNPPSFGLSANKLSSLLANTQLVSH